AHAGRRALARPDAEDGRPVLCGAGAVAAGGTDHRAGRAEHGTRARYCAERLRAGVGVGRLLWPGSLRTGQTRPVWKLSWRNRRAKRGGHMRRKLVARDVEAAVKGGAVFAAGGGGFAEHGRMLGTAAVNAGTPELVSMDEVPDDAFVATAAAIGAPAGTT